MVRGDIRKRIVIGYGGVRGDSVDGLGSSEGGCDESGSFVSGDMRGDEGDIIVT